jgi:DNA-binding SARP family transcriptional activator
LANEELWDDRRALAERWLEVEPASGDAALALMRAIDAAGTRAAHVSALAAYENLKARLARDLEIAPEGRERSSDDEWFQHSKSTHECSPSENRQGARYAGVVI